MLVFRERWSPRLNRGTCLRRGSESACPGKGIQTTAMAVSWLVPDYVFLEKFESSSKAASKRNQNKIKQSIKLIESINQSIQQSINPSIKQAETIHSVDQLLASWWPSSRTPGNIQMPYVFQAVIFGIHSVACLISRLYIAGSLALSWWFVSINLLLGVSHGGPPPTLTTGEPPTLTTGEPPTLTTTTNLNHWGTTNLNHWGTTNLNHNHQP